MKKKRIAFTWYLNWRYNPFEAIRDIFRQTIFFFQRGMYGYADEDWWSLDDYLATWLPAALREYKDGVGHPIGLTRKKWNSILEEMAQGFEAYKELTDTMFGWDSPKGKQLKKKWDKGMKLFHTWFPNLWD